MPPHDRARAPSPSTSQASHAPAEQTLPAAQAAPHAPQWAALDRVSTSQPLALLPSQLPQPLSQLATAHPPAAHIPVACAGWHSQPFAPLPSQLPKPELQLATPHAPAMHAGVPLATVHATPQQLGASAQLSDDFFRGVKE